MSAESEAWIDPIFDAVVSEFQRTGYFKKVNKHEPKKAPNTGLTAAVWVQSIDPLQISGLAATSALLVFQGRIYQNMMKEPADMVDPDMLKAMSSLMRKFHDNFDFDGLIRNVDLLGAQGVSLHALTGYLEQDDKMFRIMDIFIPCIVNDVWPQVV